MEGLRTWTTTPAGVDLSWICYTNGHRYVTNTAPDGSYAISDYQNGWLLSVTRKDSSNNQLGATTNGYDAHGRIGTVQDARTGTTTYGFDNADRVTSVTTPAPASGQSAEVTTTYFNNMGWVTNVVLPDNGSVSSSYLVTGELATNSGARTYPAAYTYDYAGRPKTLTTWTNFAAAGGATATTWTYDAYRGFLTNKTYADGSGPGYAYTAAGRLARRAWARGVTTTNSYSAAGDLSGVTYSDSTPAVSLSYDRRGRPSSVTQGSLTTSLSMNDLGQLLGESYSGGDLAGLAVTNVYDSLFRRTNNAALLNGASLGGVSFTYATASRLDTVSDGTNAATYAYLANSPLVSSVTFKQSGTTRLTTTKSYDNLNRLTQISSVPSADSTVSFNYAYNSANQRTSVTNADSSRWLYQYDTLGQVTLGKRYWSDGTIVAGQQYEYGFDDIGNRKSAASGGDQWGANLRYAYYSANNLNQYTSRTTPGSFDVIGTATNTSTVTVNNLVTSRKADYYRGEVPVDNSGAPLYLSVTNVGVVNNGPGGLDIVTNKTGNFFVPQTPESFKYDADGNLTNDGRWSLIWDAENRLVTMTANANVPTAALKKLDFGYDYRARRITKKISTWTGSNYVAQSTNKFLYDDWNLVAEVNNTNSVIRGYAWGLDLSGTIQGAGGVGGLVAVNILTNGAHFAAYDGNGNVRGLISTTNGTITGNYEYGPCGETIRAEGPAANSNPCRFSTKFTDDESDFLYYGYRYYNANTGRWPNFDPIGEPGFELLRTGLASPLVGGPNRNLLVGNDPLNRVDPFGLIDPLGGQGSLWFKWVNTMKQIKLLDKTRMLRDLTAAEKAELENLIKQSKDLAAQLNRLRGSGGFASCRLLARGGAVAAAGAVGAFTGYNISNEVNNGFETAGTVFWDWWYGNPYGTSVPSAPDPAMTVYFDWYYSKQ